MKVYLVGMGMGGDGTLTEKAKEVIEKCDIIVGAQRVTDIWRNEKKVFISYKADEIRDFLKGGNFENAAVLLSGDVGFYSGAKKLIDLLGDFDTEFVCGVSSPVYFASKLKMCWDDMRLLSIHGKKGNVINYIKRYRKVFLLLSGGGDLRKICEKLCYYGMGRVILHIGERLSYSDERIVSARAEELKEWDFGNLICVIAENENAENAYLGSISDDEFVRGNVPMTKGEVRSLSIAKLGLSDNSILYDVGAGTGSVSVEAALKIIDGNVFAIEKNETAQRLIEENKRKFAADNIEIVKNTAPEAFKGLPAPTHAFIGGSGGNMREIILMLKEKNPKVKIVINAASLNTVGQVTQLIDELQLSADIACVSVAKNRCVGKYQLMMGLNPIYIFTLESRNE